MAEASTTMMGDARTRAIEGRAKHARALADAGYEELPAQQPPGLLRRALTTVRHLLGLTSGGLVDFVRRRPARLRRGFTFRAAQLAAYLLRPFVMHRLVGQPFPVQLRRRLEMLGPTYIKLGQVLSLREDLLPRAVTDELKNLLDRLPAVPYPRLLALIEEDLGQPVDDLFAWVDPVPIGSASIAQSHRATTLEGDAVILKVVKPGISQTLARDAVLLALLGRVLQLVMARYQPRRVIQEMTAYTLREADMVREADNAETFAANFQDMPDVIFPRVYRQLSGRRVLCMELFEGLHPGPEAAATLSPEARDRIVDLGAAAVIRMLYADGFFHADLHPGNLLVLPGPRAAFIDLGMVGRLDEEVRRTLLYYYYCLVMGDPENAARYLTHVAEPGPEGDPEGFRRAVAEVSRRWQRAATFDGFSLAQLILESVSLGARYRMYFPVELVLMTKALVTFEAVGQMLKPGFDVAEVSRPHLTQLLIDRFSPLRLIRESLRGAPELIDAAVKAPLLITEGLRLLEKTTRRPAQNPFAGLRGTLFGGFCMVAGAILAAADLFLATTRTAAADTFSLTLWPLWALLFVIGFITALNQKG